MNPFPVITRKTAWMLALALALGPLLRAGAGPALGKEAKEPNEVLDLARIRPLLQAGEELAGAYGGGNGAPIQLNQGDDYRKAVAASYLFANLRHDHSQCLLLAVEAGPDPANADGGGFGKRTLVIFIPGPTGQLTRFRSNANLLLGAGDGGLQGDPFSGFKLTRTGAFQVIHNGGSADHWAITQTFQWRKDDFYLIDETRTDLSTQDMTGQAVDTNLVTGAQKITKMRGDRKDLVTQNQVAVRPLVKFSDARMEP